MPNDFSGFNAEVWAQEALFTFEEEIGVSQQFNRDFDTDFAEKGEIVRARKLGTFVGDRLEENTDLNIQDATSVEQLIKLNQHITVAFEVTDRDLRRSFRDLREDFIVPAVRGVIESIDIIAIGEQYQTYKNQAGNLNAAVDYPATVALSKVMTTNLVPRARRALWVGPSGEADLLLTDKLTEARMTGDGSPILNGQIGRASGFDIGMSQMLTERGAGHAIAVGEINNGDGYPAGTTVMTIDGSPGDFGNGIFVSIDGQVHRTVSHVGGATPTSLTIEAPGLHAAVIDDADIIYMTFAEIDNVGGYLIGHSDWIVIDGAAVDSLAKFPQVGEGIAFELESEVYGVFASDFDNLKIKLNRPLDAAISDGDDVQIFPAGAYNFAFRPGMATMVVKAMPPPPSGSGVLSAIASNNGWAMRTMLSYDRKRFKYTYSLDCLVGVKTTDAAQGALLLGVL
ncbi:MAG: P22 phage major capsid protein family protein [Nitrosopumilus sp.]